jgi:hypothetical protein
VPENAPVGFVRRKWGNYVFSAEGIDRRFNELCVMAELKNALRSGDVSVRGSRQFQDFEDYLMPQLEFEQNLNRGGPQMGVMLRITVKGAYTAPRMRRYFRLRLAG